MSYMERLTGIIKLHEGFSELPYDDTTGHVTIGYGRNLTDRGINEGLAMMLLLEDIELAESELDILFPQWVDLGEARRIVLTDMMFNLGRPRYSQFVRFWAAMEDENYDLAADEMLDSLWAGQVGNQPGQRAYRLAEMMRSGAYPNEE